MAPRLLYILYFFSGFAALCYEVSWSRQIGLLFGFTVQAASIVLLAYFVGLSLGYGFTARFADRYRFPLRAYAILEFGAGAWALFVPVLIDHLAPLISSLEENATPHLATRGLLCFFVFLPTTFALGATLPFMSRAAAALPPKVLAGVPLAYGVNTLGAFFGSWVAVFFLFRWMGVTHTSFFGAGLSILCGIGALMISFPCPSQSLARGTCPKRWHAWAFVAGFAAIALQILYTRLFSLVFHNSIYTFGVIVGVFLLAVAVGAILVAKLDGRVLEEWVPGMAEAAAISTLVCVTLFILRTDLRYFSSGPSFLTYIGGALALVVIIVMPPIILVATILPLTWRACRLQQSWAKASGALSSTNTVAGSLGAVVASFFMLETLGLFGSFAAISALLLIFAFYQRGFGREHAVFVGASLVFVCVFWKYSSSLKGLEKGERMLASFESAYGWIDVIEFETGDRRLRQNIHYGMGSTGSARMERAQTDIPLLLHPDPKRLFYAGLATGITAGAALQHSEVEVVKVVELIEDVVAAAMLFQEHNGDLQNDERVTIEVGDARHVLRHESTLSDVIIGDLFVPWESQTGYLYTKEHFATVKSRLHARGIFCQWLPLWQLSRDEFEMIANTFHSVFPKTSLWFGNLDKQWTIVGLVGSEADLRIDATLTNQRLRRLRDRRDRHGAVSDAEHLWGHYIGDWRPTSQSLNADEQPMIELNAPISNWTPSSRLKYRVLNNFFRHELAALAKEQAAFQGELVELSTPDAIREWQLGQIRR